MRPWSRRLGSVVRGGGRRGAQRGRPTLYLGAGGTFTRSTEGFYYLRAPTDGSLPFGGWAGVNVRRIEDRGDGLGSMLLMEGSRTNYVQHNRWSVAVGPWSLGTATTTDDQNAGPDGSGLADRMNAASGQFGNYQSGMATGIARVACSMWVRTVSGAVVSVQSSLYDGTHGVWPALNSVGGTYKRAEALFTLAASPGAWIPIDGRDQSGTSPAGQTARALDCYVDLHQVEPGYFPTSAIRTAGATVTRGADVLSYAAGQYPASFLDRGFRITVAPDMSSAEVIASGANYVLVSQNALNYLLISPTATVDFFGQSGRIVQSGALSWSRGQVLTIEASPNGRLVVSGATSGNGTFTAAGRVWPSATITIGSLAGGTSFFGRIGTSIVAL